ncbi:RNA polymerase-binding ATPase [Moraxella caviae]|uniref:RNA polymerase-associated protein RapA n=1 Tax=Moraxella caviae TaxID=34060 RepID=A0A1T0A0V9_9GAMM|nr:RNA polymerase-associated protein RapA [Moraxella caviae]OOR89382.1 RNA polymerase-binding ATPase [Moraxella caviae]STZ09896.1 RNA polymerase-associated protein rapA [Moraxella caviae]
MNQVFAIGQRYLSDSESSLGLGVVIDVDERCVHILFPQSEETRVYAKASALLSRVVFSAGDTVSDQDGNQYIVERCEEVASVMRYHLTCGKSLMETRLAANIQLAKPLERLLAGRIENAERYDLRQDALKLQTMLNRHPLRGLIGARVDIIKHQLYIAHEVGKRLAPRVLLADEVGLGKTIEAGLIIHQQILTGKANRVLVLVPDSLQYQWMIELKRRFNLDFALFDLVRTASIKEHNPDQNVFTTEQLIIAGIDLLLDHRDLYEQAYATGFDLLVVDEAHHLHWDSEQGGNDKYELVADFAASTAGVLLLTATPEQLGVESHFARLRLLDPHRFDDLEDFIAAQDAFADVAMVATLLIDGKPLTDKQIRAVSGLLGFSENELADINDNDKLRTHVINELLDRHGTGRVLFRNTRDSVQGFHGRTSIAYPLPLPAAWQDTHYTHGKLREQLWGEENYPDGSWLESDPRVPWLISLLRDELKHKKVLLIARSGATIESLEAVLRLHAGIKTAVFTEQMSLLERDQAAAYFADVSGAQILLCSEIGSEGRNFQFAQDLVLFDLPANPDTLEQRIGRLDRIGQIAKITLHVPFIAGTAQERLYHWYDGALNIFNQISPTAQTVQEQYIATLKPLLEQGGQTDEFAELIASAANLRVELEAELQAGRDRLLEYNSCRPNASLRIAQAMSELDEAKLLPMFLDRYFEAVNMDYSVQRDHSWIVHPIDGGEIDNDGVESLPLDEDGMTLTFSRAQALAREDMDYMTYEHPLVTAILEMVTSGSFGNTQVALLKSAAMPQGMVLVESNFRVEVIAPKQLNLSAYLPKQVLRVFLTERGDDLSAVATPEKLLPLTERLEKAKARQVIKVRSAVIETQAKRAQTLANEQLDDIAAAAQAQFGEYMNKEIGRLKRLQAINPNVRDDEIAQLEAMRAQGLEALAQLSLVPDSIRVLVTVKP